MNSAQNPRNETTMYDFECVVLSKSGIWQNKWNSDTREYEKITFEEDAILRHLRDICRIEEGTTLLDIMKIVEANEVLTMILREYSWCWDIEEFHAQVNEPMRTNPEDEDNGGEEPMTHLEIYWHVVFNKQDFSIDAEFHGVGPTCNYSVSYSPMYDIADYPVMLNTKFQVRFTPQDEEKVFEGEREFTLLDVLDAIYWDISFVGGPADNAEFLEEMRSRADEIERDMEEGGGNIIPFNDTLDELE